MERNSIVVIMGASDLEWDRVVMLFKTMSIDCIFTPHFVNMGKGILSRARISRDCIDKLY